MLFTRHIYPNILGKYQKLDNSLCYSVLYILYDFFPDDLNNARFAAYRTAMKLRLVQKKLCSKWILPDLKKK